MTDYLSIAKRVITTEAQALTMLAAHVPNDLEKFVEYILTHDEGRVVLTGIGKSGYIARKIAASFSSTGTPALYVHPSEASHGDLGMVKMGDVVIILSNSGETKELLDIVGYCQKFSIKIATITMNENSLLATNSDFLLVIPYSAEVSTINAPTVSTIAMLSLGDALVTCVHEAKSFSKDDFKIYHPGGKIGRNLTPVENLMRTGAQLPLVYENTSFSDTIVIMNEKCLGCALVIDQERHLLGIITDGDLRRHIKYDIHTHTAADIMTKHPKQTSPSVFIQEVLEFMNVAKITNTPVMQDDQVVGIINIHDLLKAGIG